MACARAVLLILLLLAGSLSPPRLSGQESSAAPPVERARGFSLEQNSPSPVDPDTWIPFTLEDALFEGRDSVVVTLRVVNVLYKVVTIPELRDNGQTRRAPLINAIFHAAGRHLAYWDGKDSAGRRVPAGIYYYQLQVTGEEPQTRKMIVRNRRRRNLIPLLGNH